MESTSVSTAAEPVMIDLGDGIKRELAYTIGMVKRVKKSHGSLQAFLEQIDENLGSVIFEGLVEKGEWTIDKINNTPFSRFNVLIDAACAALTGKTGAERKAEAEAAKNESAQTTVQ